MNPLSKRVRGHLARIFSLHLLLNLELLNLHGLFLPQIRQFRAIQGKPERLGCRLFGRRTGISGRQELSRSPLHRLQRTRHWRWLPGQRLPGSHDGHPSLTRADELGAQVNAETLKN